MTITFTKPFTFETKTETLADIVLPNTISEADFHTRILVFINAVVEQLYSKGIFDYEDIKAIVSHFERVDAVYLVQVDP